MHLLLNLDIETSDSEAERFIVNQLTHQEWLQ